jgi:hypothetical protein
VRSNDAAVFEVLRASYPAVARPAVRPRVDYLYSLRLAEQREGRVRSFNLLYNGALRLARSLDPAEVCEAFERDLHLRVAEASRGWIFVHAGVVAWHGRAVLIPGRSHTGKTSLVEALLRRGATYYSDEYAILDGEGNVLPYPKPLYLRSPEGENRERLPASALGAKTGRNRLPVGLVLLTRYRPGARLRPRALSPGRAVLGLLENTIQARTQPRLAFSVLAAAIRQAPVLSGPRGEADATADWVLRRLDAAPRAS